MSGWEWRVSESPLPPFRALSPFASFIVLLGSLGEGHHCGKSLAGFRLVYCDKEERSLAGSLSSRLLRLSLRFLRVEGETDPSSPAIAIRVHSCFNFQFMEVAGRTSQVHRVMGPCGLVIAFLDDFLFKSAVLLIFQMK